MMSSFIFNQIRFNATEAPPLANIVFQAQVVGVSIFHRGPPANRSWFSDQTCWLSHQSKMMLAMGPQEQGETGRPSTTAAMPRPLGALLAFSDQKDCGLHMLA